MAKTISSTLFAKAYIGALSEKIDGIEELSRIQKLFKEHPTVLAYIKDNQISAEDRLNALHIADKHLSKETINFIVLLSKHNVLDDLDSILRATIRVYEEEKNIVHATVLSAIELTAKEKTQIENALKKKTKKEVALHSKIEEKLIGGLKIQINDWAFDASVQGRVERLKQLLSV